MYVGDVDFFLCVVKTEKGKFVNLKFVCMYVCETFGCCVLNLVNVTGLNCCIDSS